MATGKVTIASINKMQGWLWDTQCVGFGARRQTNGLFYYVRYRHNGKQTVHSIGRHGSAWTPETARQRARQLLGTVALGTDPFAQTLSAEGFAHEVARYLERRRVVLKPRAYGEVVRHLTKQSTLLARLKLAQIDRRKVATLLAQIETTNGFVARNRVRSSLSAFFNWAIAEGLLDTNPVAGTAKAEEGASRERVLTREELVKLWRALGQDRYSDIVRLLLLTGQRRGEIGKLAWSETDFAKGMIVLPAERVKNSREHALPLSRQALAILERQPRRNSSDLVFGGFNSWDNAKQRLDQRLQIAPWRIHDLRRTCATMLGELGIQPHHIEAILNHYSGHRSGVAGVYQRAKYSDEMRSALQRWADHVDKITHIDD